MGRVKNIAIRSLGNDLISQHNEKFSDNFDKNKKVLEEVKPVKSKKVRNILAGYITTRVQLNKKRGI